MSNKSLKGDIIGSTDISSESNPVVCPRCKCESTLPELFVCYNVSPVCPKCILELRAQQSTYAGRWLFYFSVGLIIIFWALITFKEISKKSTTIILQNGSNSEIIH